MATKTFVTDKDGATADASSITMPSDRHFRNAWKLSGSVMAEDMTVLLKLSSRIKSGKCESLYLKLKM